MNTRNPETFVNRSKRIVQNAALALAIGSGVSTMVAPVAEASSMNSADCLPFQIPQSGPIEGKMRVSASRRFMLNGENVSQSLNGSPEVFNSVDEAGNTMETVTVGRPTFYDLAFDGPDGSRQISRSRFPQGSMDTNSYWIQPDNKGEQQNVGEVMTFTMPDTGERYDVVNNCGVTETRRGFTLQAALMFRRGEVLKPITNGLKRILELCITNDHWTHTAQLQRPGKPEVPAVVPTPTPEVPPTTDTFPGQYPAQYTPYSR
jgi:hypothetical protein